MLRGINVSGQKKIIMAELRSHVEKAGFNNVLTYIQSGNIILAAARELSNEDVADKIRQVILANYGYEVGVFALQPQQLRTYANDNPFLKDADHDQKKLYLTILSEKPSPENISRLRQFNTGDDKYIIADRVIYLNFVNGAGKSKLSNNLIEAKLRVGATSRNWNTTLKLLELSGNNEG